MTTIQKTGIQWQSTPGPEGIFPLGGPVDLCLGMPWKWLVAAGGPGRGPTLFAYDLRKDEYRIWQTGRTQGGANLVLRLEHHGIRPGWHAHRLDKLGLDKLGLGKPGLSALDAPRAALQGHEVPILDDAGFWSQPLTEQMRAMFPFESMPAHMLARLEEVFADFPEAATLHAVPFGAAVGLGDRRFLGDTPGFYIGQLGSHTPLFRLEDDGTTIPLLQAAGLLPADRYFHPESRLGGARDNFIFGPESRCLFTPFFPMSELADRARDFAQGLGSLWELHMQAWHAAGGKHPSWTQAPSFATL